MGNAFIPYQGSRGTAPLFNTPDPMEKVIPAMSQAQSAYGQMQPRTQTPGHSVGGAITGAMGGAGVAAAASSAGLFGSATLPAIMGGAALAGPAGLALGAGVGMLGYLLS